MKSVLNYNYFINLLLILIYLSCSEDKGLANKKRTEECNQIVVLNILSNKNFSEEQDRMIKELKFSYSCSSIQGESPSCIEYYREDPEESFLVEFCKSGYTKFKARCSRQNVIGECYLFQANQWEKIVFAKPNDTIQDMEWQCKEGILRRNPDPTSILTILNSCRLKKTS